MKQELVQRFNRLFDKLDFDTLVILRSEIEGELNRRIMRGGFQ